MEPTAVHSKYCDALISWFNHGYHDLVEKTLFSLPLRVIIECSKERPEMGKLTKFYLETTNPRVQKILEIRTRQEWLLKDPIVEKVKLTTRDKREIVFSAAFDLIADDRHIFLAVEAGMIPDVTSRFVVLVLDAKSFEVILVLEIANVQNWLLGKKYVWMRLAITEDYLVANTGYSLATEYTTSQYDQFIWLRKKNYEMLDQQFGNAILQTMVSTVSREHLITDELRYKPIVSQSGFYWPILFRSTTRPPRRGLIYHHFSFDGERFNRESTLTVTLTTTDRKVDFRLLPTSSESFDYIAIESGHRVGEVEGSIGMFSDQKEKLWQVKKLDHSPKLIGIDENCLVIVWIKRDSWVAVVNVLNVTDGSLFTSIDCTPELRTLVKAKVSGDRVAIGGSTLDGRYDIIVWDIPTGEVLLRCGNNLKLQRKFLLETWFLLEKNRILLPVCDSDDSNNRSVFSVKFWV